MTDHDQDRFDRDLSERLKAAEQRATAGAAPQLPGEPSRGPWGALALLGASGIVVAVVAVSVLIQARPPAAEATPSPTMQQTAPAATPSPGSCMAALLTGTLVRDEAGVLVIETPDRQREHVVWPAGWGTRDSGGRLELVDGTGQVIATEGDHLQVGGGETADGLWEACPTQVAVIGASPAPSVLTQVTATAMEGFLPGDNVLDIGAIGDEQIAVGQAADGLGLWVRRPGDTWSQVTDQGPLPHDVLQFHLFADLAVGSAGAVAVGGYHTIDFGTPRIAFTRGDMTWTNAYGPTYPGDGELGSMSAVTATEGGWVAVGSVCPDGAAAPCHASAWISINGTQWAEVAIPGLTDASGMVAGPDRLVVVGSGTDGNASSAISMDGGNTWQAADLGTARSGIGQVTYYSGVYVAAGALGDAINDPGAPAIWISADGLSWDLAYRGPSGHAIRDLIAVGDRLVAVGGQFPSWLGDGSAADTVEVWTSSDGRAWDVPQVVYRAKGKMIVEAATLGSDGNLAIVANGVIGSDPTRVVPVLIEGPML